MNSRHAYLFLVLLELFIGKFMRIINHQHAHDYFFPGDNFCILFRGKNLPRQGGLAGVVQRVTPPLRSCLEATKTSSEQLKASDRPPKQS